MSDHKSKKAKETDTKKPKKKKESEEELVFPDSMPSLPPTPTGPPQPVGRQRGRAEPVSVTPDGLKNKILEPKTSLKAKLGAIDEMENAMKSVTLTEPVKREIKAIWEEEQFGTMKKLGLLAQDLLLVGAALEDYALSKKTQLPDELKNLASPFPEVMNLVAVFNKVLPPYKEYNAQLTPQASIEYQDALNAHGLEFRETPDKVYKVGDKSTTVFLNPKASQAARSVGTYSAFIVALLGIIKHGATGTDSTIARGAGIALRDDKSAFAELAAKISKWAKKIKPDLKKIGDEFLEKAKAASDEVARRIEKKKGDAEKEKKEPKKKEDAEKEKKEPKDGKKEKKEPKDGKKEKKEPKDGKKEKKEPKKTDEEPKKAKMKKLDD
jgi:hypothetical protein